MLAAGDVAGLPYFTMPFVEGESLRNRIRGGGIPIADVIAILRDVTKALAYAHTRGIVHRDIKPSNILFADDSFQQVVLTDFGLARLVENDSTLTRTAAMLGTPSYMSPEQASLNNLDIDTRSDVYALGVLLYELLPGTTPIDRRSLGKAALLEVLRMVREVEAPRPSTKLSTADALPSISANRGTEPRRLTALLRGELDWIVLRALEKDRNRRYETANGFAADVQRYLAGEPPFRQLEAIDHPAAAHRGLQFRIGLGYLL